MSREVRDPDLSGLPTPCCDFCGGRIEDDQQQCPALDEGVCRP
jgi:hypothetical protein